MTSSHQMLDILDRTCIQSENLCPRARDAFSQLTQKAFDLATPHVDKKFSTLSVESRNLIASALAQDALEKCMRTLSGESLPFSSRRLD